MPSTVSVIIPTHDRAELVAGALRSLRRLDDLVPGDEVVVVANACSDDTVSRVRRLAPQLPLPVRLVEEPVPNLNVARNAGARAAAGDILAFIDDDVEVAPGWLGGHRRSFDEHGADLGAGPVLLSWDLVERPHWLTPRTAKLLTTVDLGEEVIESPRRSAFVGANLALRTALWRDLGGFVEGLDRSGSDLLSGGDAEFVDRALGRGARGVYEPRACLFHVVTPGRPVPTYLAAVAEGRGRTRVVMSRMRDDHRPLGLFRIGVGQLVLGTWWRLTAGEDMARRVDGMVVAARGRGTLRALLAR